LLLQKYAEARRPLPGRASSHRERARRGDPPCHFPSTATAPTSQTPPAPCTQGVSSLRECVAREPQAIVPDHKPGKRQAASRRGQYLWRQRPHPLPPDARTAPLRSRLTQCENRESLLDDRCAPDIPNRRWRGG